MNYLMGRYGYNGNSSGMWINSKRFSSKKVERPTLTTFGKAVVKLNKFDCVEDKLCFIIECESNCILSEGEIEDLLEMI